MSIASLQALVELPANKRPRIEARFHVIQLWEDAIRGMPRREGTVQFAAEYNAGRYNVPPDIQLLVPHVDRATLYRWRARFEEKGLAGLADAYGNRAGTGLIDTSPNLQRLFRAVLFDHPDAKPAQIMKVLAAWDQPLAERATEHHAQQWLRNFKERHKALYVHKANPDKWKSHYKAAFGDASAHVTRLNQVWELDSTPADILLVDGRYCVLGCIDVYSRRFMLLVSRTSKAVAIAALLRRCILEWGIPEGVLTDNGQDYRSIYFGHVLRQLGISQTFCVPFASEQKPHIERAFKTLSHDVLELLPGYIGHSVADRKAIESRKSFAKRLAEPDAVIQAQLDGEQLQQFCNTWIEGTYSTHAHGGLDGATPLSRVSNWSAPVRRLTEPQQRGLDVLLTPHEVRTVGKKGISFEGADFCCAELGDWMGQPVVVRPDPTDLGRIIVQDGEWKFIGIAVNPERTGIPRAEVAAEFAASQKRNEAARMKAWKESRRSVGVKDFAEVVLQHQLADARKVTALPRPSEGVTIPALEGAQAASEALAALPATATATAPARPVTDLAERRRLVDDNDADWRRFETLRDTPSEQLSALDQAWMLSYQRSPGHAAMVLLNQARENPLQRPRSRFAVVR